LRISAVAAQILNQVPVREDPAILMNFGSAPKLSPVAPIKQKANTNEMIINFLNLFFMLCPPSINDVCFKGFKFEKTLTSEEKQYHPLSFDNKKWITSNNTAVHVPGQECPCYRSLKEKRQD
jgi:hypothetical protein